MRLRYVDMMLRPEPRAMVRQKAAVLKSLRATLDDHGFVEVETPILQLTNGGAAARPFRTHLNALDQEMLLRIALELDLKRAMIGGVDRVYEIGRTFRNEGLDATHAAEFSMLEAYEAYGDQHTMISLVKDLVRNAHRAIGGPEVVGRDGSVIDLGAEWREAPILGLVSEAVGATVDVDTDADTLRKLADEHEVELQPAWGAPEIVVELFEQLVEDTLIQPTFVMDYPESVKPLAKSHRSTPGLNEAWDLIINGVEMGAAYSELNDPVVQRERLEAQSRLAAGGDPEAMELDEVFLKAMEYGMPPAGGIGIGVDRVLGMLTGASAARDDPVPAAAPGVTPGVPAAHEKVKIPEFRPFRGVCPVILDSVINTGPRGHTCRDAPPRGSSVPRSRSSRSCRQASRAARAAPPWPTSTASRCRT